MPDSSQPLWLVLVGNLVMQAAGYFAVVGSVYIVVWRLLRERLRGARIPAPDRANGAQIRREVLLTFGTFIAGTSSAGVVLALHGAGLTRLDDGEVPVWVTFAWTAAGLAFNDLWFYSWHRLMHRPLPFRWIHAVHHKSVDVNPFTSYAFHAVESVLVTGWLIPFVMLVPLSTPVLMAVQVAGLSNNVMAHLGYELLPAWWVRAPVLRWSNSATFHSLHHARFNGNYGLFSRVWDRWFGTELDGYEAAFSAAHAEAPASGGGVD